MNENREQPIRHAQQIAAAQFTSERIRDHKAVKWGAIFIGAALCVGLFGLLMMSLPDIPAAERQAILETRIRLTGLIVMVGLVLVPAISALVVLRRRRNPTM